MIINILGSGALGCFYGSQLLENKNLQVNFLARSNYQILRQDGIKLLSPFGNKNYPHIDLYDDIGELPKADFTILTCKTSSNKFFYSKASQTLKDSGVFVLIQNGIGEEIKFSEYINNTIIGVSAFISCSVLDGNTIRHESYGDLTAGLFEDGYASVPVNQTLQDFASLFNSRPFQVNLSDNLGEVRWKKLVWNVAFNGLTTLYNCTTDLICNTKEYYLRAKALMLEIQQSALSYGIHIKDDFIQKMLTTHKDKQYKPSMYIDFINHRPLEIDAIYGAAIELAAVNGVELPEMKKVYRELAPTVF